MKNILAVFCVLGFFCSAQAEVKISCTIDMPCGWLKPVPVEPNSYLGYCVDRIEGNEKQLTAFLSDGNGISLDPVILTVQSLTNESILAANSDSSVVLSASQYATQDELNLAGGLLIKTKRDPFGLGLFTSCEVK